MKLDFELADPASVVEMAAELCRPFEAFRSEPYLCPARVPTIGYGTTRYPDGRRVTLTDPPCTEEAAEAWMRHELGLCAKAALRACPVLAGFQAAWAAITDFVYNLGAGRLQTSTLRRMINRLDWPEAIRQLMRWNKAAGRVLRGLTLRREAEARLLPGYVPIR